MNELKLTALKSLLQDHAPVRARKHFGFLPGRDSSVPLQAGNLIEILGEGQMTFVTSVLKDRPESRVAWLSDFENELCPLALVQEKVELSRILFLEKVSPAQGMDILLTILKSQLFSVLVFPQCFLPKRSFDAQVRKLTLTAEESGSILLMLSQKHTSSYGINIQVDTEDADELRLNKVKGGIGTHE